MERRTFLSSFLVAVAAACTRSGSSSEPIEPVPPTGIDGSTTSVDPVAVVEAVPTPDSALGADAFALGVASGDPDDSSVVLWTRLSPEPDGAELDEEVAVAFDLANDEAFDDLVVSDRVAARSDDGWSLHVLAADLPSDGTFWYRFRTGDQVSAIGRTRTMPAAGQELDQPFVLGVSSCQLRQTGAWAAHRDLAEAEVDLVIWLGDYIYENDGPEASTLEQYRERYAEYRSDPLIQASHGAAPWFATWDDHEVVNDYDAGVDPDRLRAAAQAWWEFTPTRLPSPRADGSTAVHRRLDVGDLVRLAALDVRQYADDVTQLGDEQRAWLAGTLDHAAAWTLIASPVVASGIGVGTDEALLPYTLDGYPEERVWLADELAKAPGRLIVSGDLHASAGFAFSGVRDDAESPVVATEFMAPPISSAFPEQYAAASGLLPLFNGHMEFFETNHGWLRLDLTPTTATATYRIVADVADPGSAVADGRRFQVARDQPGMTEI